MQIVPVKVQERSSCQVTISFFDRTDGSTVLPNSNVLWSLLDLDDNVINNRDRVAVSAATSITFTLSGDDLVVNDQTKPFELRQILVETTYDNGTATVALRDSGRFMVENLPTTGAIPVNTVSPVVSGTPEVAATLTCSTGTWSYSPTAYSYQWLRDGEEISGETASTYDVAEADLGTDLSCDVSATNTYGTSDPVESNALSVAPA